MQKDMFKCDDNTYAIPANMPGNPEPEWDETESMSVAYQAIISDMDALCRNSIDLIRYARGLAVQHVNIIELMTNYALGRWIVEEQQNGQDRAQYGV